MMIAANTRTTNNNTTTASQNVVNQKMMDNNNNSNNDNPNSNSINNGTGVVVTSTTADSGAAGTKASGVPAPAAAQCSASTTTTPIANNNSSEQEQQQQQQPSIIKKDGSSSKSGGVTIATTTRLQQPQPPPSLEAPQSIQPNDATAVAQVVTAAAAAVQPPPPPTRAVDDDGGGTTTASAQTTAALPPPRRVAPPPSPVQQQQQHPMRGVTIHMTSTQNGGADEEEASEVSSVISTLTPQGCALQMIQQQQSAGRGVSSAISQQQSSQQTQHSDYFTTPPITKDLYPLHVHRTTTVSAIQAAVDETQSNRQASNDINHDDDCDDSSSCCSNDLVVDNRPSVDVMTRMGESMSSLLLPPPPTTATTIPTSNTTATTAAAVSESHRASSCSTSRDAQFYCMVCNACQPILAAMRLDPRYVAATRFTEELSVNELYPHPLYMTFSNLVTQMQQPQSQSQDDSYLEPFCTAIRRQDVSAGVTLAVLDSIQLLIQTPGIVQSAHEFHTIADALVHCAFEETHHATSATAVATAAMMTPPPTLLVASGNNNSNNAAMTSATTATNSQPLPPSGRQERRSSRILPPPPPAVITHLEEDTAEDEQAVAKLLQICVLLVQTASSRSLRRGPMTLVDDDDDTTGSSPVLLGSDQIMSLLDTCWHVRHKAATASPLLKSIAGQSVQQIISTVCCCATADDDVRTISSSQDDGDKDNIKLVIIRRLSSLLAPANEEDDVGALLSRSNHGPTPPASTPPEFVTIHALSMLLSITMDSNNRNKNAMTDAEQRIWQGVVARDVMSLAIHTTHATVLRCCIRLFDQLIRHPSLHMVQMKCELEAFIHTVYLRRLRDDSNATMEEKEVVLESLLQFCHVNSATTPVSPVNLKHLYWNYDCDHGCTNLCDAILSALGQIACPANWTTADVPSTDETRTSKASSAVTTTVSNSTSSVEAGGKGMTQASANGAVQQSATSTAVVSSYNSKPLPMVTVASQTSINIFNRLALQGILSTMDMIGMKYKVAKRTRTSTIDKHDSYFLPGAESLTEESVFARKQAKDSMVSVVEIFNSENPDKGAWLDTAVKEGLLSSSDDCKGAASLLYKIREAIDKERLGIYLSRGPDQTFPFNASVRNNFAAIQNFKDLSFPAALRKFLSTFRLPGEAQCIDRLMESFSKVYYEQQGEESCFKNPDAVYVIAFSTIMLNTDLHNPTIKAGHRMTKQQFVRNNRGINGGSDLSEEFLSDLYDQIKECALQVRPAADSAMKNKKLDFNDIWNSTMEKKKEVASSVYISSGSGTNTPSLLDKKMFLLLVKYSLKPVIGIFAKSWDDAVVVRSLRGLQQMVTLAASFDLDCVVNDVLQALLPRGREYIMNCIANDQTALASFDGGASQDTLIQTSVSDYIPGEDETTTVPDNDSQIPFRLLSSSENYDRNDVSGSATNRGLLALDTSFILLRKNSSRVTDAWPAFIDCLCVLRDARALPVALSELDDFADSSGKVLPLSSFARASQKRLDAYHRSLSDKDNTKQKGWFQLRSFFRKGKAEFQNDGVDDDAVGYTKGKLSVCAKTLLGITIAADVENILQMGSSQLPDATIRTLLDGLDAYPFENDPSGEQHAVFTLELAVRALLSNRERAEDLFVLFLSKFESILAKISDPETDVPAPFVIERLVVTILRSCIHLYEYPELRANLWTSLQLTTTTLPTDFIRAISDRMACGLAIILRASYHLFETHNEWSFLGDSLDVLAHYSSSRVFVFDGIASTVEFALANPDGHFFRKNMDEVSVADDEDRPKLSLEACSALSRLLTRFVLGFYQGDLTLSVPSMLCLEKVYRRKVEILLAKDGQAVSSLDNLSAVPDKDHWQNVAVAVYSVCRSPDPDASNEGVHCYRRIVLRTHLDHIPNDKWVAIMYLMANKQPPVDAEVSRGNTFSVLGHLIVKLFPTLSHHPDHRDDLEELVSLYAALAEENMQRSRRGCLFEVTLQTLTYISNLLVSDEWKGDKEFSLWANETLLKELDRAGQGGHLVTTTNTEDVDDVSEISDSVAEEDDNYMLGSQR